MWDSLVVWSVLLAAAAEWSGFRGPNASGIADAKGWPMEFGPAANVVWKNDDNGQTSPQSVPFKTSGQQRTLASHNPTV